MSATQSQSKAETSRCAEHRRWLFKSEPGDYSIDDLARDGTTLWDGVRNYQVRNLMRDMMSPGQEVMFYHSSCAQPGVVGIARITGSAHADPTQFDKLDKHYDPAAKPEKPRWVCVAIGFVRKADRPCTLKQMRADPGLSGLQILRLGNRLSIVPVSSKHWQILLARL